MNIPKVEKSEIRTRSHPRLFRWGGGWGVGGWDRQGEGNAPEDSTVPTEGRQAVRPVGPSLQQPLAGLWAQR